MNLKGAIDGETKSPGTGGEKIGFKVDGAADETLAGALPSRRVNILNNKSCIPGVEAGTEEG